MEELVDTFEGEEYPGKDDFGPAEELELDDIGTGAIIASIHIDEDQDDDDTVVYVAAMAMQRTPNSNDDTKVTAELVKSVREDYEIQGSGIKPQSAGMTNWQIKANSNKDWASNSNVRSTRPGNSGKMHSNRQGLAALVKINGVEAYMWWDTGSELDTISPDFTRVTGIKPKPKESTLRIDLGTKGSSASTLYKVTPTLDLGNTRIDHMMW